MLIDTDVLIWNLRGNEKAADFLDSAGGFCISAVSYMELVQGARNRNELLAIRRSLPHWGARIQPLGPEISSRAMFLMEIHALGDGLQVADALIAASAIASGESLVTANDKHYRMIEGLDLRVFRP